MIKKSLTLAICIILALTFVFNSHAATQMIVGVQSTGIYNIETLLGTPSLIKLFGEALSVSPFDDHVVSVHSNDNVLSGYCDKNDLIYENTLYFPELPIQVSSSKYSYLVDTSKYSYLFKTPGLLFLNDENRPMLIQQATYFKLQKLATTLDSLGYNIIITRAYLYTDENGTQDYAKGCRLDFEVYAGSIRIPITLHEYDENGEIVVRSELEDVFNEHGFVRIGESETFEDENENSYLAYEVDFDNLSYIIMD